MDTKKDEYFNHLLDFFSIDEENQSTADALKPPSCGGGDQFKFLALEGDKIMDVALIKLFQEQGIVNSGIITQLKQQFHNARCLVQIGNKRLHLDTCLTPIDYNYKIQDNEIKESIEALIAASDRQNGPSVSHQIVKDLFNIAFEEAYLDIDYVSELNLLLQQEPGNPLLNWGPLQQIGGMPHNPIWQILLDVQYKGKTYKKISDACSTKTSAKRNVAMKILQEIIGLELPTQKNSVNITSTRIFSNQPAEVPRTAAQSLLQREITFSKPDRSEFKGCSMNISRRNGETLLEWAERKARKNPYGMLILLSAILPNEIKGSSWKASIENGELILLNIQIEDEMFFETGFGKSKSQARKQAANKIIKNSNLFRWLTQHHLETIK